MRIIKAAAVRAPAGTTITGVERMSRAFTKYHLDDGRALHRFTQAEPDSDPHDHPWSFGTLIVDGGYIEEVFTHLPDGSWNSVLVHRRPGEYYRIDATHIHRIVELPTGECWTVVDAAPSERETRFWRFGKTVQFRAWHERRWAALGRNRPEDAGA